MKEKSNFGKFLLWSGELISSVGGGLTSFGLGVYIFDQTGSAANMVHYGRSGIYRCSLSAGPIRPDLWSIR